MLGLGLGARPARAQADPAEAATADGSWRLRALGTQLLLSDGRGHLVKTFDALPLGGGVASRISALAQAAGRRSFVVAFESLPELWEISLDPAAGPIHDGYVHDYRMAESIASAGYLGVRRTKLDNAIATFVLSSDGGFVLGSDASGQALQLVQIDIRRTIARWQVASAVDLARARSVQRNGRELLLVPERAGANLLTVDPRAARLSAPAGQ